jgi:hypothetical protein
VAAIASAHMGFLELGVALTIAGVGTSLVFPTVANEVLTSVPESEVGIASGTNSAIRELGGVFGVAVLASVFTRHGVYTSPAAFIDGFKPAVWVAAGFSAAGVVMAVSALRRPQPAAGAVALVRPGPGPRLGYGVTAISARRRLR